MIKKIVIDTCVLVSALKSVGGMSRLLLHECLAGHYEPLVGTALFTEYEALMGRKELFSDCPLSLAERDSLLDALMSVSRWVHVYYLWRPNLKDEDDNHVLELAVAGNADAIVTHNLRDFKNADLVFSEIDILSPKQFLRGH